MPESIDPFDATLIRLRQERAELDNLIAALERRRGQPSSAPVSKGHGELTGASQVVGGYRGEFFNLSVTKAAEKLLRRSGRPLKTPEILEAFNVAEFEIRSRTPRATIYTSLRRSRDFVKVAPDTWDMSERHPQAAQMKEQELQEMKTAKSKKKRKPAVKAEAEGLRTVA